MRYAFGPLDVASMLAGGLVVSGSADDLAHAAKALSDIPGLAEYQPD